jgi:hypothetical protein
MNICVTLVLAAITLVSASAEARPRTLSQLPPAVAQTIRMAENDCRGDGNKPHYRLGEVVHQRSLSGPRARDYIVDLGQFRCRGSMPSRRWCGATGNCEVITYLNPRPGKWVAHEYQVINWYTIRRPGKKTALVMWIRCYESKDAPCRGRYYYSILLR